MRDKIYTFMEHICPVCGKKFIKAPQHVWKTQHKGGKYICSYSCCLRYDREMENKKEERRKEKEKNDKRKVF